jgi:hypothetical protein
MRDWLVRSKTSKEKRKYEYHYKEQHYPRTGIECSGWDPLYLQAETQTLLQRTCLWLTE